jgi:hypothetical protein
MAFVFPLSGVTASEQTGCLCVLFQFLTFLDLPNGIFYTKVGKILAINYLFLSDHSEQEIHKKSAYFILILLNVSYERVLISLIS